MSMIHAIPLWRVQRTQKAQHRSVSQYSVHRCPLWYKHLVVVLAYICPALTVRHRSKSIRNACLFVGVERRAYVGTECPGDLNYAYEDVSCDVCV